MAGSGMLLCVISHFPEFFQKVCFGENALGYFGRLSSLGFGCFGHGRSFFMRNGLIFWKLLWLDPAKHSLQIGIAILLALVFLIRCVPRLLWLKFDAIGGDHFPSKTCLEARSRSRLWLA